MLSEGHSVFIVDNLSSGFISNVPNNAEFLELDIRNQKKLQNINYKFDVIYHLASHVGQELSFESPQEDLEINLLGTQNLINFSLERNPNAKFIFASSMNVYGNVGNPLSAVSENISPNPPSPYAVGKISSEYLLNIYSNFGLNYSSLRLFNVYGSNQDLKNLKQGMVSIFLSYILKNQPIIVRGSLERFRDFIHVFDVVDAFRILSSLNVQGVYNVCNGVPVTVKNLIRMLLEIANEDINSYPIRLEIGRAHV